MTDVFISYSRRDADFVRRLAGTLEAEGLAVWVDWEGIPATAAWMMEIYRGIEGADHFLLVVTPHSLQSEMCGLELAHAVEHRKRLIPLRAGAVSGADLPPALASVQWLEIPESQPFAETAAAIARTVRTDPEAVRLHTRLLTRAVEWQARTSDGSLLLRGAELQAAERWLASGPLHPEATDLHRHFVAASRRAVIIRRRWLAGLAAAALAMLAGLGMKAWREQEFARQQERMGLSRALAAAGLKEQEQAYDRGLLLAVAALDISPTLEAESALQQILLARPRLERILPADSGRALGLGFSPDAQRLAVGLGDGSALIWNLDDGRPAQRLATDGSGYADAIAFDADLTLAAVSGGNRNAVTVRRLADGATTAEFPVQDGSPSQKLLFAPDGKSLARVGGSQAAGVIVWDLATGKPRFPPLAVDSDLSALALSPDGSRIAGGGWSPNISIWDVATGAPRESRKQVGTETFTVYGLALGPQPGWLAAAAGDGVQLFDLAHPGKGPDWLRPRNDRAVRSVAIDPAGHWLAAGYERGGLRLWGLAATDRPGESLDGEGSYVDTLAFSSDGSRLASGGYDQPVRVFSTGGIARFGRLLGRQKDAIAAVAFSPDGEWIAAGGRERVVGLWPLAGGEGHQAAAHRSDIRALAFSREGLLSADARILPNLQSLVAVLRWRLDGGPLALASPPPPELPLTGLMAMFPDLPALRDTPWPVALSADGQRLARLVPPTFGSVQIRIEIVATEDDRVLATLVAEHTHSIVALAFSGDGHRLATAGADGRFEVWDAARGQRLAADRVGENRSCQAAALSADGSRLAVGCGRDLAVWDLDGATHAQIHLDGHASDITALALDTSGRRLAAADRDSGWTLWDIASGRAVGRSVPSGGGIEAMSFSPDGSRLATGGGKGTVMVWDVSVRRWRETACRIAGRGLTPEERARYLPGVTVGVGCAESRAGAAPPA